MGVSRPRPTVIEMLGLPGSGKSTVVHELTEGGIATMSTWNGLHPTRWPPVAVQLVLRAPLLSALTSLTVATRRRIGLVHLRRTLSVQRRHLIVKAQRSKGVLALDEGPVHALFIALYGTRSTVVSRWLLRVVLSLLARRVDRFVFLDVPRERCVENFRRPGRSSARFNEASSPATIREFMADRTYDEILHALGKVAGDRLVVVDSVGAAYECVRAGPVMPALLLQQDAD
jgi:hypothetical protein